MADPTTSEIHQRNVQLAFAEHLFERVDEFLTSLWAARQLDVVYVLACDEVQLPVSVSNDQLIVGCCGSSTEHLVRRVGQLDGEASPGARLGHVEYLRVGIKVFVSWEAA